ncbi:CAP domain-containing protein [Roseivirga sp.]|uniref:CAP domain-containing protein n=1 Tax=Roseivirga sp. TaxID=1964215 RepID=UPI003B8E1D46
MKKPIILLLLLLGINTSTLAQRKWKDSYYTTLTDENFRDFKLFQKSINLKKIDYKVLNAAVFFVTNEARLERGLKELEFQPNLEIMAYNHSISMAKKDFFDHYNKKDKKRRDPQKRAGLAGVKNPAIAENISAVGGRTFGTYLDLADHLVQGWLDSPPHRKTLYSETAVQLGCGTYYYDGIWQKNKAVYRQGNGFWLATQNFQLYKQVVTKKAKDKGPSN